MTDLLIREQFISTCSEDKRLLLRERVPTTVEEMTKLAEQYMEAHGGSITQTKRQNGPIKQSFRPPVPAFKPTVTTQAVLSNKDKICYFCHRRGHISIECKLREQNLKKYSAVVGYVRSDSSDWRHGDQRKRDKQVRNDNRRDETTPKPVGLCTLVPKNKDVLMASIEEGKLKLANGESIPFISGACNPDSSVTPSEDNTPVYDGFVNGKKVRFLKKYGMQYSCSEGRFSTK